MQGILPVRFVLKKHAYKINDFHVPVLRNPQNLPSPPAPGTSAGDTAALAGLRNLAWGVREG